jgi:uncharacterized OB-fold protein
VIVFRYAAALEGTLKAPTEPGTWRRWVHLRNVKTFSTACPKCGAQLVWPKHSVAPDGTVRPSMVCTHPGCSFHEFGKLEGWSES